MGKTSLNKKDFFLPIMVLLWVALGPLLLFIDKGDFVLWLNQNQTTSANFFFRYFTHVGDGITITIIGLLLFTRKFYPALFFAIGAIVSGLLSQLLKRTIFEGWKRPVPFFEDQNITLQLIEGVKINHFETFPSGHTAAGFALAYGLYIVFGQKKSTVVLFVLMGLGIGLSRIYLSQHFLVDTYFGSIIGVFSVIIAKKITFYFIKRKHSAKNYYRPSLYLKNEY